MAVKPLQPLGRTAPETPLRPAGPAIAPRPVPPAPVPPVPVAPAPAGPAPGPAVSGAPVPGAAPPGVAPTARGPVLTAPRPQAVRDGLQVDGVGKSFRGRSVVNGVSLNLKRGEVVGLLGPNGAGKTTCFYMITGLIAADYGVIRLDGEDITGLPMYQRARLGVGYLPQEASIFRGMTVGENVLAVTELHHRDRRAAKEAADRLLEELRISHLRAQPAPSLSGGERRRVEIARALASEPSFMLLDEPFAGIDPLAINDIKEVIGYLARRGIGVLITDHNVRETLELVERASIIAGGEVLFEGSPEAIKADPEVRRVYLGSSFGE